MYLIKHEDKIIPVSCVTLPSLIAECLRCEQEVTYPAVNGVKEYGKPSG